jgi:LysM repeat protein
MKDLLRVWATACAVLVVSGCGHMVARQEPTPTSVVSLTKMATIRPTTATPKPATPVPTPTFTPSPTPIIHTIQKGDTLLGIANKYGVTVQSLQEANGILDPRRLQLSQELIVPQDDLARTGGPPTATPTPVAYAIENIGFYHTSIGSLWFLGEVHNTTSEPIEQVQILVTLQTEGYVDLSQSSAFSVLDFIGPGGRSPFAVLFSNPPVAFDRYQVIALAGVTRTHPGKAYHGVSVISYSGQPQGDTLAIRGDVKNTGASDAEAITILATGYDSGNRVAAIRAADLPMSQLPAGETSSFRMNLLSSGDPIVSYTVQVQAYRVR